MRNAGGGRGNRRTAPGRQGAARLAVNVGAKGQSPSRGASPSPPEPSFGIDALDCEGAAMEPVETSEWPRHRWDVSNWETELTEAAVNWEDVQGQVISLWEESESVDPTCPYRVLQANLDDEPDQFASLRDASLLRWGLREEEEEDHPLDVVPNDVTLSWLLRTRVRRAYQLVIDPESRWQIDDARAAKRDEGSWGQITYPNGSFVGGIVEITDNLYMERDEQDLTSSEIVREGKGINVVTGGELFEGEFKDDQKHGVGLQFFENGDAYVGQWSTGVMHGLGIYFYGSGNIYSGHFLQGKRHGSGRLTWENGSVYQGDFECDARSGNGVLRLFKNGRPTQRYAGEWRNNAKHGEGAYTMLPDVGACRYQGEFSNDRFHGEGKIMLENGERYNGAFADGHPHGVGNYHWIDSGSHYAGEMKRGRVHGHGCLQYGELPRFASHLKGPPRGWRVAYDGQWVGGVPHGYGSLSGDVEYTGEWRNGLKEGRGMYTWPKSSKFIGQFAGDRRHGEGRIEWPDGAFWRGFMCDDIRHGFAKFWEPAFQTGSPRSPIPNTPKQALKHTMEEMAERWHRGTLCEREQIPQRCDDPEVDDLRAIEREYDVHDEGSSASGEEGPGSPKKFNISGERRTVVG